MMSRQGWAAVAAGLVLAVAGCSAPAGSDTSGDLDPGEGGVAATSQSTTAPATTKPAPVLGKDDFELSIKQVSKNCYGSGVGCNVEYEVKVAVDRAKLAASGKSYDITYDVTGDENGTQTGTITLLPDGTYDSYQQMASTKARSTTLKVKLTDLEANNY